MGQKYWEFKQQTHTYLHVWSPLLLLTTTIQDQGQHPSVFASRSSEGSLVD
jgi:hypothetical protein